MFDRVKFLADKKGLSLSEVSLGIGQSQNYLYNLKKKSPSSEVVQKLADYFNVSTDYLLGRTEKPYYELNAKDEKDIEKELERMIDELDNGLYSKETAEYSDETRELLIASLEQAVRIAKMEAKRKFTPKKYRNE